MQESNSRRHCSTTVCALALLFSGAVYGGDGVIEINQARAVAGGVTAGDAGGFPVTINAPGSYRLTGNLAVPDENTTGIFIAADHVTVDLNGFAIIGPVVCTATSGPAATTCSASGTGSGIDGRLPGAGFAPENITITNGTVRGMGNAGVRFIFGRVERVRVISNGGGGIEIPVGAAVGGPAPGNTIVDCWAIRNGVGGVFAGEGGRVTGNLARFNGGIGIDCVDDCVVSGNTANSNAGPGINCFDCAITGNTTNNNGGDGIGGGGTILGNSSNFNTGFGLSIVGGYAENSVSGNGGGTVGGSAVEIGGNACNGTTTCP